MSETIDITSGASTPSEWWSRLPKNDPFYIDGYHTPEYGLIWNFHGEHQYLSNFCHSPIIYDNKEYQTVEHLYQALKTVDPDWHEKIRTSDGPGLSKKYGRECPMRHNWEHIKFTIMRACLARKFAIPEFKKKLLDTGYTYLIEGTTWHDNEYGICIKKECKRCADKTGSNMLGILLMEKRRKLAQETQLDATC